MTTIVYTRDGAPCDTRARATVNALLDSLADHLAHTTWRAASVPRIACAAGNKSTSTFYTYFPNLETALFALVQRERAAGREPSAYIEKIMELIAMETGRSTGKATS